MKTLFMSSSFTTYSKDENGKRIPRVIDNDNGFLDNLKKVFSDRRCMVIISGRPKEKHLGDPNEITRKSFEMSGIPFDEYIYVSDENKQNIKQYVKKASVINLFGGHLPTANAFINELNLRELIKDFDGVVVGASGGAMNMADDVYCIPEVEGEHKDKQFNRILKGLGLTNINIIPHYHFFEKMVFSDGTKMMEDILLLDSIKTPMIGLPDRSYIIQRGDKVEVFGPAYDLSDGEVKPLKNHKDRLL